MSPIWKPGDRVRLTAEMGGYRSGTVGTIKRVHHDHVVVDMKGLGHERDAIPVTFDGIEREEA